MWPPPFHNGNVLSVFWRVESIDVERPVVCVEFWVAVSNLCLLTLPFNHIDLLVNFVVAAFSQQLVLSSVNFLAINIVCILVIEILIRLASIVVVFVVRLLFLALVFEVLRLFLLIQRLVV